MKLTQQQEKLAMEIAHVLGDMKSLKWHRKMVGTYSEEYLRGKLADTMATPESDIIKSRGALYNTLVQGHR